MAPVLTVFNARHHQLHAKMMDFGGWEMPLHYGSQIGEHLHTRSDCSLFDVSHMAILDCFGSQVKDFLLFVLANNIEKLSMPGKGLYSCMLNPEGGIIDDLIVYRLPDRYRLVINASTALQDIQWLKKQSEFFSDVNLIPRRLDMDSVENPEALIAIQGPKSEKYLTELFPTISNQIKSLDYFQVAFLPSEFGQLMFARTGYTGEDGFEISIPLERAVAFWDLLINFGVKPAGLGARDTLRIEAGYNLYGQDMSTVITPLDCGLSWTVDLDSKRDFIGKTSLLTLGQKMDFLGLVLNSKGVLRGHQKIITPLGSGEVTSGTYSPSLQKSIGLARLPKGQILGGSVQVVIRDQTLDATLVKPQFVRRGQFLI